MQVTYHQVYKITDFMLHRGVLIIFLIMMPLCLFSQNPSELLFKYQNKFIPDVLVYDINNNYLGASDKTGKILINYKGKVLIKSFLYNDTCIDINQDKKIIFLTPKVNILHTVEISSKVDVKKLLIQKILELKQIIPDTTIYYSLKYSTTINNFWKENFNAFIQITYEKKKIMEMTICEYNYDYNIKIPDTIYNSLVLFIWKKSVKNLIPFLNKNKLKKMFSHSSFMYNNYGSDSISIMVETRTKKYMSHQDIILPIKNLL